MKFDILATRNNDAMFRMSKLLHLYDRKNRRFFRGKKYLIKIPKQTYTNSFNFSEKNNAKKDKTTITLKK